MGIEIRPVLPFNMIALKGRGHLIIEQGDAEALRMEGPDEALGRITTGVKDGSLEILYHRRWLDWFSSPHGPEVNFFITARELREIKLVGAGSIKSPSLKSSDLSIAISGAGNADLRVEAQNLKSKVTGSADLRLSGSVNRQDVTISGAAKYLARDLASNEAFVEIRGAGNATLNVAEHLRVRIAGTGDVSYTGTATLQQSIVGVGTVVKMEN
jgi:hypothetical protein